MFWWDDIVYIFHISFFNFVIVYRFVKKKMFIFTQQWFFVNFFYLSIDWLHRPWSENSIYLYFLFYEFPCDFFCWFDDPVQVQCVISWFIWNLHSIKSESQGCFSCNCKQEKKDASLPAHVRVEIAKIDISLDTTIQAARVW